MPIRTAAYIIPLLGRSEALIRHLPGLDYRLYWHLPRLYSLDTCFRE